MKRFLICLFSFLFIGCSIAGGTVLLSNSSYSDEYRGGDSSNSENDVTKNAPTNDDLWTDSGNYSTNSRFGGGSGTSTNPYKISTPQHLARLAYIVNSSFNNTSYQSAYYIQTANIDLSAHYWEPIGTDRYLGTNANGSFRGHYDGGGYTISGVYTVAGENYQGLFGYVRGASQGSGVSNVTIIESNIQGNNYIGGILGYYYIGSSFEITNCSFSGSVLGNSNVGGILGDGGPEISDCSFSGSVTGNNRVGGIIGNGSSSNVIRCNNSGSISGDYVVGGITGNGGEIVDCYNIGSVTSLSTCGGISGEYGDIFDSWNSGKILGGDWVGGIIGNSSSNTITNCYNIGDIELVQVDTSGYVGGILGQGEANIGSCYNTGNIIGNVGAAIYIGGIAGNSEGLIINCYNTGEISSIENNSYCGGILGGGGSVITNCYNIGTIGSGMSYYGGAGGIVGELTTKMFGVMNCFNLGAVNARTTAGGAAGGIAGRLSTSTEMVNCYWGGDCTLTSANGSGGEITGCGSLTESDAKSSSWYNSSANWDTRSLWNFSLIWQFNSGVNNNYPVLNTNSYTIFYDIGYGNSYSQNLSTRFMFPSYKANGVNITLKANTYTRFGYRFSYWNNTNGSVWRYDNQATYSENQSTTLVAAWDAYTYTITYDANGGEGTMASSTKSYGSAITLRTNTFTREGYTFKGWATSANGSVVYADGARYTSNASITLYAVWERAVLNITIDWQFGDYANTSISLYYNQYYADESGQITSFDYDQISHAGFSFMGCYTSPNGQGSITVYPSGEFVSTTITQEDDTWYCYWVPNLSAMYDESGYWYVELGMMPQTKVTDEATITALEGTGLNSGNNYRFGDLLLESSVYGNEEYCEYNGNWYRVEPIRWRLDYSTSQTVGFGTTEDTLAVMDTIVFVSQFSNTTLNSGDGYSTTAVTALLDSLSDTAYFVTETKTMPTFGSSTINGTAESVTSNIFVASREEITEVAGGGKIQFSDLVRDYLLANGQMPLYYTRDLGTNYNNIFCMNGNGESVQYKPQNYFGVQFSVLITEYACIN